MKIEEKRVRQIVQEELNDMAIDPESKRRIGVVTDAIDVAIDELNDMLDHEEGETGAILADALEGCASVARALGSLYDKKAQLGRKKLAHSRFKVVS